MDLSIQDCKPLFSPNIEIKCIAQRQKKALEALEQELNKVAYAKIKSSSLNELSEPLKKAQADITKLLIPEHEENNHDRDKNKIDREINTEKALKKAGEVIVKTQEDLVKAEQELASILNSLLDDYVEPEYESDPSNEQGTTPPVDDSTTNQHLHPSNYHGDERYELGTWG